MLDFQSVFFNCTVSLMKSSKFIAIGFSIIALAWIGSGFIAPVAKEPQKPEKSEQTAHETKIMRVQVKDSVAENFSNDVVITGRSQASQTIELKAETAGQVEHLFHEEGDYVTKGTALARLEVKDRNARVAETEQRVKQREIEFKATEKLAERGFSSEVKLSQARADLEAARAALRDAQVARSKVDIRSPLSGMISTQNVEEGDYLSVGGALFTIVKLNPIEITGYVSERQIGHIQTGAKTHVKFLNGLETTGKITYVAPAADPQTRTFRIIVSADNTDAQIKDGLTAQLHVPATQEAAHRISPSILTLDDEGRIGVKLVDQENRVVFMPVNILADETQAMWVTGLPENARIITVGQEFVKDGQTVEPVTTESDGLL